MSVSGIVIFVVIVVLIIIVVHYVRKDVSTLTGLISGKTAQKIEATNLGSSASGGNSSNFTYSIWFFVDDWNYRYGEPKVLFGRMTEGKGTDMPCPSAVLGPLQNNIIVSCSVYPGLDEKPTENASNSTVHSCMISNVPIQRWCNLLVSVYGRTLDTYLDGKLVRTCVLPGVAKIDASAPVYVTPMGGFSGWTARFQYWGDSVDPQTAWNVYNAGYGGSLLGSIFNKYAVKVSVLENNTESSSVTI